jgi:hypothetical protein
MSTEKLTITEGNAIVIAAIISCISAIISTLSYFIIQAATQKNDLPAYEVSSASGYAEAIAIIKYERDVSISLTATADVEFTQTGKFSHIQIRAMGLDEYEKKQESGELSTDQGKKKIFGKLNDKECTSPIIKGPDVVESRTLQLTAACIFNLRKGEGKVVWAILRDGKNDDDPVGGGTKQGNMSIKWQVIEAK